MQDLAGDLVELRLLLDGVAVHGGELDVPHPLAQRLGARLPGLFAKPADEPAQVQSLDLRAHTSPPLLGSAPAIHDHTRGWRLAAMVVFP